MIDAAREAYPNAKNFEWNPDKKILKVEGVEVDHKQFESRQNEIAKAHSEMKWAAIELEGTDVTMLRGLESGVESKGLKAYRENLRKYYRAIEAGEAGARPVLDDRSILKKTWDVLNTPMGGSR